MAFWFYKSFAGTCGPRRSLFFIIPSSTQVYLMTGLSPLSFGLDVNNMHNLSSASATDVSQRLTRLVNSFWIASIAPDFLAGGMDVFNFTNPTSTNFHPGTRIDVTVDVIENVYICDDFWLGILYVSSSTLCLISGFGMWLNHIRIAPVVKLGDGRTDKNEK